MSLAIRTFSNKLPTSFSTRNRITHLDRLLQDTSQSKINSTSAIISRESTYKSISQSILSDPYKQYEDNFSVLKLKGLKKNYSDKISKTQLISYTINCLDYKIELNQRNGFRIQNHNNYLNNIYLYSTQPNLNLKEKKVDRLENSRTDDLTNSDNSTMKTSGIDPSREGRPTIEQIEKIKQNLSYNLPLFFVQLMDYHIYTHDIIFINNIRGTKSNGFFMYYLQMSLFKIYSHIKFIYVKLHVIKITANPEDDSVKIRWRITGITGSKLFTRFFSFKNPFKVKETIQKEEESWYDGFSTFYINSNGKVYKHVVDKMMPDSDQIDEKKNLKIPVKLAICGGISNIEFLLSDICKKT